MDKLTRACFETIFEPLDDEQTHDRLQIVDLDGWTFEIHRDVLHLFFHEAIIPDRLFRLRNTFMNSWKQPVFLTKLPVVVGFCDTSDYRARKIISHYLQQRHRTLPPTDDAGTIRFEMGVGVDTIFDCLNKAQIEFVRILSYGRKMKIEHPVSQNLLSSFRTVNARGSFDIAVTVPTPGLFPLFKIPSFRRKGTRIYRFPQLLDLGRGYGGVNIEMSRQNVKIKIYNPLIHLIKHSTKMVWTVPEYVGGFRPKLKLLERILKDINARTASLDDLGGYRIEVTLSDRAFDEAYAFYRQNRLYCLDGIYEFIDLDTFIDRKHTLHVVPVQDYIDVITGMVCAVKFCNLFKGAASNYPSLTQRRVLVDMYIAFGFYHQRWKKEDISFKNPECSDLWEPIMEKVLALRDAADDMTIVSANYGYKGVEEESPKSRNVPHPIRFRADKVSAEEIFSSIVILPSRSKRDCFDLFQSNGRLLTNRIKSIEDAVCFIQRNYPQNHYNVLSKKSLKNEQPSSAVILFVDGTEIHRLEQYVCFSTEDLRRNVFRNRAGAVMGSFSTVTDGVISLVQRFGSWWPDHLSSKNFVSEARPSDLLTCSPPQTLSDSDESNDNQSMLAAEIHPRDVPCSQGDNKEMQEPLLQEEDQSISASISFEKFAAICSDVAVNENQANSAIEAQECIQSNDCSGSRRSERIRLSQTLESQQNYDSLNSTPQEKTISEAIHSSSGTCMNLSPAGNQPAFDSLNSFAGTPVRNSLSPITPKPVCRKTRNQSKSFTNSLDEKTEKRFKKLKPNPIPKPARNDKNIYFEEGQQYQVILPKKRTMYATDLFHLFRREEWISDGVSTF